MRRIYQYIYPAERPSLAKRDTKAERLKALGVLNPEPSHVRAPWFGDSGFFDPRDLVQVKYEMLRHARLGEATKANAASLFGLSRPTFYQAESAFARDGITGLLPRQRGPKGAHKLTAEVMAIIEQHLAGGGPLQARELSRHIEAELGVSVHPRSIERAVARKKKR